MINIINRDLIKEIVAKNSPISKPQIAQISSLSLPTINKTVDAMVEEGLFKKAEVKVSHVGRKADYYELEGDSGSIIALYIENDFTDGYVRGALADMLGNIIYREDRKIDYSLEAKGPVDLFEFINSLIKQANKETAIKAISFGIPGVTDGNGYIYRIPNIISWEGINLKKILEKEYDIPTFIENDVNLTAVGVLHKFFLDQKQDIVYMYFGKGIGAGIIIRGKLYKGKNNFAGEFSHLIISNPETNNLSDFKSEGLYTHEFMPIFSNIMNNADLTYLLKHEPENRSILNNQEIKLLMEKVSYLIINMIVLLNPEVIAIRGLTFNQAILDHIKTIITGYMGANNCPDLLLIGDSETGLEGTIKLGLSHSFSNYSFINNKGV